MSVSAQIFQSVVKLFVTSCSPNYVQPWQMEQQEHSVSSGFIISGNRIMCNAHGVAHARSIRIRKQADAKKWKARISHIGHECDLAILEVDDAKFWHNTKHLEFGEIPNLQATVVVVGYPIGGDRISVTKGVVSRVGFIGYSHSQEKLLAIQIDAAINDGNSGGPTIRDNKVVGVAFQSMDDGENVGYCIPSNVALHFLQDIKKHGKFTGFPRIGFNWQAIENPSQRKYLGMTDDQDGILVTKIYPLADCYNKLKPGDVVLKHDNISIANDGTVPFRNDGERILHNYITIQKFIGDVCKLSILRNHQVMEVDVKCGKVDPLVPVHLYDVPVTYFILGGVIFVPLSQPLLEAEYGENWIEHCPISLADKVMNGIKYEYDEEVVILRDVLAHDDNIGYHDIGDSIVNFVNNIKVKNVKHLATLIQQCEKSNQFFVNIEVGNAPLFITLDLRVCKNIRNEILEQNNILFDRSENLRKIDNNNDDEKDEQKELVKNHHNDNNNHHHHHHNDHVDDVDDVDQADDVQNIEDVQDVEYVFDDNNNHQFDNISDTLENTHAINNYKSKQQKSKDENKKKIKNKTKGKHKEARTKFV